MLVKGGDPTNGKAISPVNIRHGNRVPNNAWQMGDIGHLLQTLVFLQVPHHGGTGKDEAVYPHLACAWNTPAIVIDALHLDRACFCHRFFPYKYPQSGNMRLAHRLPLPPARGKEHGPPYERGYPNVLWSDLGVSLCCSDTACWVGFSQDKVRLARVDGICQQLPRHRTTPKT